MPPTIDNTPDSEMIILKRCVIMLYRKPKGKTRLIIVNTNKSENAIVNKGSII